MRLHELSIRNFRALENIRINFRSIVDVIVGPNAVGKTTILEGIRIARALLAPRILQEAQQALIGIGAISPHLPQQINFAALARDTSAPLVINCKYELTQREVEMLDDLTPDIVNLVVQSQMGPIGQDRLGLVQFLSSPQGRTVAAAANDYVKTNLGTIKASKMCNLDLTFDPQSRNFAGADLMSQLVIAAFELKLPPQKTLFNYFPTDRAMPLGEVAIQVGGVDVNAQLLSYNAQPQTKFQRLKTTIVNTYLLNPNDINGVVNEFKKIFSNLMKDREMLGLNVNNFGLVSVQVKDLGTGQTFDLDGMSSGEKGLILTFLLIGRSIAEDGIVLIDEPELHLNPAVCKVLLPFLIDGYLKPLGLQAIICSHSPEILGVAFDHADCSLHHLQSPTVVSPILPQDRKEVFDALRRLGTSTSDALFSSGSIFVEGEHDIEILEAGFPSILNRYNVTHLEGRANVEKEIRTLLEAEKEGKVDTLKCFIFDLDQAPTNLASTSRVKVSQWDRRCIENYLINETVIYDVLRDDGISQHQVEPRGALPAIFQEIALSQLDDTIATIIFKRHPFASLGPPAQKELFGKSFAESAEILFNRISAVQTQICNLTRGDWSAEFQQACEAEKLQLHPQWEARWRILCDGKRFFRDLQARYEVRVTPIKLKVRIMERLAIERAEEWVLVNDILRNALKS